MAKKIPKVSKRKKTAVAPFMCEVCLRLGDNEEKTTGTGITELEAATNALKELKPKKFNTTKGVFHLSLNGKPGRPNQLNVRQMTNLFVRGGLTAEIQRTILAKRLLF